MTRTQPLMDQRDLQIGICGTFDVENYGDLLFPLIAERELERRLGRVTLHRFSYRPKSPPDWPYVVRTLSDLPAAARDLDGMIIGGGDVIRFDKEIAPGYGPTTSGIHHPTGYWLAPMLIALQEGCPVVWNAPGVYGDVPAWAEPMLRLVIAESSYVAVRDRASQQALSRVAPDATISIVPDTAHGVATLVDLEHPAVEFSRLCTSLGLNAPYIVVQATTGLEAFVRLAQRHPDVLAGFQLVVLPIGPILGDDAAVFGDSLPGSISVAAWPAPWLLAELIARAAAVVGVSLHLAITALAFGVPLFRPATTHGKFAILSGLPGVMTFDDSAEIDPDRFTGGLVRPGPSPILEAARSQLSDHWDRIASTFTSRAAAARTGDGLGRFWESMPGMLETWATRAASALAERDGMVAERASMIADRDARVIEREQMIAERTATLEEHVMAVAKRDAMLDEFDLMVADRDARIAGIVRIIERERGAAR
jgi:lipopolysaccharide transport system ATP-binding protein